MSEERAEYKTKKPMSQSDLEQGVIKPCPFCGGEAKLVRHETDFIINMMIGCKTCLASTSKFRVHASSDKLSMLAREQEARAAWNRRAL